MPEYIPECCCCFLLFNDGHVRRAYTDDIQGGREMSAIIVTDDYLCYKEPESPYNFFFIILIFNELFKFKTSEEWQH